MEVFQLILCIIGVVVFSSFVSRFIPKVSTPLVQIAMGAIITQVPGFPNASLNPELFMVLFSSRRCCIWKRTRSTNPNC